MGGIAHPVAAAGVLTIFLLTAVLLKLARMLYLKRKAQVFEIDASPKGAPPLTADRAADIEAKEVGTSRPAPAPDKMFDGCSLRVTGRPQTPEDVFAMQVQLEIQRRQLADIEEGELDDLELQRPCSRGTLFSERPQSKNSRRPWSRGGLPPERPQSRTSTTPSKCTDAWPDRPQSRDSVGREACQKLREHYWNISGGIDPHEFWDADVDDFWDSPQRPWSRSSKQTLDTQWSQGKHNGIAPPFPRGATSNRHIAYSSWPAPQKPNQGAYFWTSWAAVESAPKLSRVASGDEFPSEPPRPHTAPTPSPAPNSGKQDQTAMAGDHGSDKAATPPWKSFLGFVAAGKARKIAAKREQEKLQQKIVEDSLVESMLQKLEETRSQPLSEKKRIFRDLQRQLHPDKNVHCAEAAKLAFQELMMQRNSYLVES